MHLLSPSGLPPVLRQGELGGEAGSGLGAGAQRHLLGTLEGPLTAPLCGDHICWKVVREAHMELPGHAEYVCSGRAVTRKEEQGC